MFLMVFGCEVLWHRERPSWRMCRTALWMFRPQKDQNDQKEKLVWSGTQLNTTWHNLTQIDTSWHILTRLDTSCHLQLIHFVQTSYPWKADSQVYVEVNRIALASGIGSPLHAESGPYSQSLSMSDSMSLYVSLLRLCGVVLWYALMCFGDSRDPVELSENILN